MCNTNIMRIISIINTYTFCTVLDNGEKIECIKNRYGYKTFPPMDIRDNTSKKILLETITVNDLKEYLLLDMPELLRKCRNDFYGKNILIKMI